MMSLLKFSKNFLRKESARTLDKVTASILAIEAVIKCNILNKMTAIGMPLSYAVG